ncbi:MAG: GerMN domain-containing protein [Blautia sp.]|nr:GerMN domain-containing protein [Blautia sp.]
MEKQLKWLLVTLAACCLIVLVSPRKLFGSQEEEKTYYKYFVDSGESELIREIYEPEEETCETMLRELMTGLSEKETAGKGISLLPAEVNIESYEIVDDVLQISFNSKYSKVTRAREILMRVGIVKTFVQVPGISAVRFFVGKDELMNSRGEPVGEMGESTFAELSGSDRGAYRYDTFTLYFTDENGKKLLPEVRNVYYRRTIPRERVILEQLIKGPMEKDHYPTLPDEMTLLDVDISDRVCYAKFDSLFLECALEVTEEVAVYSVVNSLLSNIEADKVQILIDGKKEPVLGEDMQLYNFFELNKSLVAGEDKS